MALRDYRLCDHCGCKTFYSANLNTDADGNIDGVGSLAVLCEDCAKTHKAVIITWELWNDIIEKVRNNYAVSSRY